MMVRLYWLVSLGFIAMESSLENGRRVFYLVRSVIAYTESWCALLLCFMSLDVNLSSLAAKTPLSDYEDLRKPTWEPINFLNLLYLRNSFHPIRDKMCVTSEILANKWAFKKGRFPSRWINFPFRRILTICAITWSAGISSIEELRTSPRTATWRRFTMVLNFTILWVIRFPDSEQ